MSELITTRDAGTRRTLLATTSALALAGYIGAAQAESDGHPTIWIELGGQLERVDSPQGIFAPPFFNLASPNILSTMIDAQRPSRYSTGAEGSVKVMPGQTDWVFTAAIRYGQSKNARHLHYETAGLPPHTDIAQNVSLIVRPIRKEYGDGQSNLTESHVVLDFRAGKDVGLGLFHHDGSSVVSAGVRLAQFSSSSDFTFHARPVYGFNSVAVPSGSGAKYNKIHRRYYQEYTALAQTTRSTHAVGPSVSWDASLPVAGNDEGMSLVADWGVNASVLFGRQRSAVHHQTTGHHLYFNANVQHTSHYAQATGGTRSRSVTIPNIGGFAGLSLKFPNAKVSLGYRGDFFFNATDSGLDARDAANRNFYGPFATISIGLGG
jgi:hypothetical protein